MMKYFAAFEENEFLETEQYIQPMFHCLCLVWVNSLYYCNSTKIITLLQEMANMMIEGAMKELDPGALFQGDPDEAVLKIAKSIQILKNFM